MKISAIINALNPMEVHGCPDIEISGINMDSRLVSDGDLFVAVKGTQADGHSYIPRALEQGAKALLVSASVSEIFGDAGVPEGITLIRVADTEAAVGVAATTFYGNPTEKLKLVGVTGTNGKTTIATVLYELFTAAGHRSGLCSTVCNYIDNEPVPATHTTPDALELNRLLRRMLDAGCQYAFMEVSSHAIAQERVAGLDYDGALFTNLTRDHIDYHKTFDNYRDTKKRLFDSLKADAFVVTNRDDKNGLVMTQNTRARVHTYSTRAVADYHAQILEEGFDGMLLKINNQEVFVPLVGRFNVSNLLCIYGAALCLGFEPTEVLRILSTLHAVNGRFETIRSPKGWTAIVDYAHTPDAVENVIQTINEIKKQGAKLITVVGCGGNRDKGKRPMMAAIAKHGSEQLILTSDNPRDEEPADILRDMAAGLTEDELRSTLIIEDRESAIHTACTLAQQDDVILIAGKGHEDYQIIKGVKHHFDDHEIVKKYTL